MSNILVVGASGTVGSELVKLLKAKGHKVKRTTSKTDLEQDQVHLNLLTQKGLDTVFDGIDKAFFMSPPGYTNQHELIGPLVEKAKQKNLKKVVFMTAMGANAVEAAPMRQAEIKLEKSGLAYNIIRPNWFMQNHNSYWINGILAENTLALPVGDAKGSFIDARDIAATAAELLDSDKFNNQDFDLTGERALNHSEVVSILSKASGRKISFKDITPTAMLATLLGAGLPKDYSEFMIMILGFFKEGYAERTTDSVLKITGKKPISFEQYANDYKAAWA